MHLRIRRTLGIVDVRDAGFFFVLRFAGPTARHGRWYNADAHWKEKDMLTNIIFARTQIKASFVEPGECYRLNKKESEKILGLMVSLVMTLQETLLMIIPDRT